MGLSEIGFGRFWGPWGLLGCWGGPPGGLGGPAGTPELPRLFRWSSEIVWAIQVMIRARLGSPRLLGCCPGWASLLGGGPGLVWTAPRLPWDRSGCLAGALGSPGQSRCLPGAVWAARLGPRTGQARVLDPSGLLCWRHGLRGFRSEAPLAQRGPSGAFMSKEAFPSVTQELPGGPLRARCSPWGSSGVREVSRLLARRAGTPQASLARAARHSARLAAASAGTFNPRGEPRGKGLC